MWRSIGFLMSFAVVIEGMTLIAYIVILTGGVQKRRSGWKLLSGMLLLVGAVQVAVMSMVVSEFELQLFFNVLLVFALAAVVSLKSQTGVPLR